MVDAFLKRMYGANPDFVFTVTRDFVRGCQTPILVLPDDVPAHPYAVAMESARLAPNAEVSIYPWKETKEQIAEALRHVRELPARACTGDCRASKTGQRIVADRPGRDSVAAWTQRHATARSSTPTRSCGPTSPSSATPGVMNLSAARSSRTRRLLPEHGVILGNLAYEINGRLRSHPECRSEVGSGAAPQYEQRDTARIPDAMIRCGKLPRVLFEVISPSELQHKRQWDQKRADLQAVEGVQEIVEIYQDEMLAHAYRRQDAGWVFESIAGPEAQVALPSVGITVPLAALYERVLPEGT